MAKKIDRFPYAKSYTDRHGKRRWRFRVKGFSAELGTEWGSEDFSRRYADAQNLVKSKPGAGASRTVPGTLNDLVSRFYTLHLPTVGETTRKDYMAVIDPLRPKHGHKRVAHMRRRHVLEIKADLAGTPQQANKTLKRLSQLMDLAVELEWRTDNPVRGIKRFPTDPEGFHTWDEGEIAQFYACHAPGSPAHLAMTLMLYTGAAKCDAVQLGRGNVRDGVLSYRRKKTRKNPDGILVEIPVHPFLAEALSHVQQIAFTYLATENGLPRSVAGLGSSMRRWCDKAKLPLCSSHGLRKAICRRIAEAGGTAPQIMSVSGHISLKEAQRYCAAFGRKKMAEGAIALLPHGSNAEQNLANHPARFVSFPAKSLKGNDK